MPHMTVIITADKYTTRDGSHPDDELYSAQQLDQTVLVRWSLSKIEYRLKEMGFGHISVEVNFNDD